MGVLDVDGPSFAACFTREVQSRRTSSGTAGAACRHGDDRAVSLASLVPLESLDLVIHIFSI